MSLVVFTKGTLLTDRLGIKEYPGNVPYKVDMQKLFVHESNLFAVGICGDALLRRQVAPFMEMCMLLLAYFYMREAKESIDIQPDMRPLFDDRSIILMTRDHVFCKQGSESSSFTEIDNHAWMGYGTYTSGWRVAHTFGLKPIQAAEVAIEHLLGLKPTIDSIQQKDLKRFPKIEQKQEKKATV